VIISIVVSVCASVLSGAALFFMQRAVRKREAEELKRRKAHKKENILILKSIKVLGELTEANSIAIRDGKTNGELKHALADYSQISGELEEFLIEQTAEN